MKNTQLIKYTKTQKDFFVDNNLNPETTDDKQPIKYTKRINDSHIFSEWHSWPGPPIMQKCWMIDKQSYINSHDGFLQTLRGDTSDPVPEITMW